MLFIPDRDISWLLNFASYYNLIEPEIDRTSQEYKQKRLEIGQRMVDLVMEADAMFTHHHDHIEFTDPRAGSIVPNLAASQHAYYLSTEFMAICAGVKAGQDIYDMMLSCYKIASDRVDEIMAYYRDKDGDDVCTV